MALPTPREHGLATPAQACGTPEALQKVAVLPAPGGRASRKRRLGPSMVIAVLASPSGRRMVSVTLTCENLRREQCTYCTSDSGLE